MMVFKEFHAGKVNIAKISTYEKVEEPEKTQARHPD